jgi:hypothetical protein
MKALGTPTPAAVGKVEKWHNRHGTHTSCTVVETTGERAVHVLGGQENCDDRFKPLQRVTLRKDPLGLLDPRLPDGVDHPAPSVTMEIAAGLFVLTGATMFYAGRRRRPERRPARTA